MTPPGDNARLQGDKGAQTGPGVSSVPYNTTPAQWVHSSLTALEPAIANHRAITREVNGQCQVCSNTTSGCDVCGSCCHVCGLGRAWEPVRVRVEDVESDAEYSHPGRVSRGMPKIGQGGLGLGAANRFWGRARAGKNSYDIHVGWWDACSQTRAKKIGGGLRRGSGSSRKPCAAFISSAPCLLPEELQIYVHPRNPYQRGLAWPFDVRRRSNSNNKRSVCKNLWSIILGEYKTRQANVHVPCCRLLFPLEPPVND